MSSTYKCEKCGAELVGNPEEGCPFCSVFDVDDLEEQLAEDYDLDSIDSSDALTDDEECLFV